MPVSNWDACTAGIFYKRSMFKNRHFFLMARFALPAAALLACTRPSSAQQCQGDSDCRLGTYCNVNGAYCRTGCREHSGPNGCLSGFYCYTQHTCTHCGTACPYFAALSGLASCTTYCPAAPTRPPPPPTRPPAPRPTRPPPPPTSPFCYFNSACGSNEYCASNRCAARCSAPSQCPSNQHCTTAGECERGCNAHFQCPSTQCKSLCPPSLALSLPVHSPLLLPKKCPHCNACARAATGVFSRFL